VAPTNALVRGETILHDVDGDGAVDALTRAYDEQGTLYLAVNRDGAFEAPRIVGRVGSAQAFAAVDVDLDGTPDLCVLDAEGALLVFRGTLDADGRFAGFSPARGFVFGGQGNGLAVTDLDGDAIPDLLVTTSGAFFTFFGDGRGGFRRAPAAPLPPSPPPEAPPGQPAPPPLEGEGVPPRNDDFASATVIQSLPFSEIIDTSLATVARDDPLPSCARGRIGASVWYAYTPRVTGTVSVSTSGSSYLTVIGAYTAPGAALEELACSGAGNGLVLSATGGVTYYFFVASDGGGGGTLSFGISDAAPPPPPPPPR
jgi:hypothetical protein